MSYINRLIIILIYITHMSASNLFDTTIAVILHYQHVQTLRCVKQHVYLNTETKESSLFFLPSDETHSVKCPAYMNFLSIFIFYFRQWQTKISIFTYQKLHHLFFIISVFGTKLKARKFWVIDSALICIEFEKFGSRVQVI